MRLFNKLFGVKKKQSEHFEKPNNNKLISLLKKFNTNQTQDNFKKVFNEIMHGNCEFYLPSIDDKLSSHN